MRKYFALTTPLVALMAVFLQGFIFAEHLVAENLVAEDIIAEDIVLVNPSAEKPITELTVKKGTSLFRHSTYPTAWTAAQKSNRPILVYVSMPNCPHCVKMVKNTYDSPEVGNLVASSFETVYAGRFTHAKLVQMLKVKWYPTTILVGSNNKILDVIEGYVDSKTFQRRLQTGLATASTTTQTR